MLEIIMTYVQSVREREEGQALVEYALILALVSIAAIATLTAVAGGINGVLTAVSTTLTGVVAGL
jgi:Flp pilus assembly pilin Flp